MPLAEPGFLAVAGAAWLLSFALHSTFLLGMTALLARRRLLPASLEQTLWRVALVGSLLTATVLSLGWDGGALGTRIRLAPPDPVGVSGTLPGPGFRVAGETIAGREVNAHLSPTWTWGVLSLWAVTAVLGLGRLAGARVRLRRELGRRREVAGGELREQLDRLCRAAGVRRRVHLTLSSRLGAPIAIGRREICLPTRVLHDLPPEEIESALAHELAHLERRDPVWKGFAAGLGAVFFFQPLLRFARRRMVESAEFLADDWAIRHTRAEISLARCLAEVASWHAPGLRIVAGSNMAASMAGGDSPLLRRVERILGRRPKEPSLLWQGAVAIALLAAVWSLAPGVTAVSPPRGSVKPEAAWVPLADLPGPGDLREPPGLPHMPGLHRSRAPLDPGRAFVLLVPRSDGERPHARTQRRMVLRVLDQDTAPAPRVFFLPHEQLQARMDLLRTDPQRDTIDAQTLRAFLELEFRLAELRRAMLLAPPPAPSERI